MTITYSTRLESPRKGWLFLYIPNAILGTGKRVWLKGTLNDKPFIATANPWKNDSHAITINKLMRKQLGIDRPIDVELKFAISEKPLLDLGVPTDLRQALNPDKSAHDVFQRLAPAHQKEFIFYIEEAKTEVIRQRNIRISIALLRRNRHLYEDPAHRFADDLKESIRKEIFSEPSSNTK